MPSVAFYNQIVKPGMTKVEVSNKAQSDAVSDSVAALNLSLPNGEVVETKLVDNTISLAPGEFGKLVLSAPNTRISSVGSGSSFARGLVVSESAFVSGIRFDCDADGSAVTVLDGAKVVFTGCRFHRSVSGGESSSSRHVFWITVALCLSLVSSRGRWESLTRYSTRGLPAARLMQSAARLFRVLALQSLTTI